MHGTDSPVAPGFDWRMCRHYRHLPHTITPVPVGRAPLLRAGEGLYLIATP
jgi:hypothetical protein